MVQKSLLLIQEIIDESKRFTSQNRIFNIPGVAATDARGISTASCRGFSQWWKHMKQMVGMMWFICLQRFPLCWFVLKVSVFSGLGDFMIKVLKVQGFPLVFHMFFAEFPFRVLKDEPPVVPGCWSSNLDWIRKEDFQFGNCNSRIHPALLGFGNSCIKLTILVVWDQEFLYISGKIQVGGYSPSTWTGEGLQRAKTKGQHISTQRFQQTPRVFLTISQHWSPMLAAAECLWRS